MNEKEWNKLSDGEKNRQIDFKRGETLMRYDLTGKHIGYTKPRNYMGDMNLCMELLDNLDGGYVDLIRDRSNKNFEKFVWYCAIPAKGGDGIAETPQSAICTAYAKAVGIITEE